jgi:hypothetical protein
LTARLLLANALELVIGLGVASALRLPLGTAYLAGLAVVGIVSAHVALVHVSFGWIALSLLAAASLVLLWRRRPAWSLPRPGSPWAWGGLTALVGLLAWAWPTFAAKPLDDYDGWAIWGMKAKALTLLDWADPALFASEGARAAHLDYPLLVPSLEAIAARTMGGFEPRLVHLQFLLLGVAAIAALHALLHERVQAWLLWPFLVALATAPAVSGQLLTAYADLPLAFFVAGGLVAAARWATDGEPRLLALATLFLGAACLTKNEGVIFAAATYAALLLATRRWRPLVVSALAVEAMLLPWQVWLAVRDVHSDTLLGLDALEIDHPGIGPEAVRELLEYALSLHEWPLLLPLFVVAVLAAAGSRLAVFAWAWALASLLGLAWIYVVSELEWSSYLSYSGDRVVASLVVGATALAPLLAQEGLSRIAER